MSLRLFKIVWVVTRHRLDTLIPAERLPLWMRLLLKLSPLQLVPVGQRSRGERLRLAQPASTPASSLKPFSSSGRPNMMSCWRKGQGCQKWVQVKKVKSK